MEEYISEQKQIHRPASMVYRTLADFTNFTPILADKVEGWQATADTCSFKVKGFNMALRIVERQEDKMVKIEGDESSPFEFGFWVQLVEVEPEDTRMKLSLHIKLNTMMKMMVGGKIQEGIDQIADQIAYSFNNAPSDF